jgi:anthranilate phosphoribosyltransferase
MEKKMLKPYLEKIATAQDLTREEAAEAMEKIINEEVSATEIGGFLTGLRVKGESIDEISGFIDTMRKHMIHVPLQDPDAIDVCGTGGDGTNSFNVSTTAALVVAGGGVTVAKHGNRSVSSKSGSADLLEALEIKIDLSPQGTKKCIDQTGIGFFFAPQYHPAMKAVVSHRKNLGIRTVFNMLGPLLNPANVKRQLIGTFDFTTAQKLAGVLKTRNYQKACTVHSADGYDELSPFTTNFVFEVGKSTDAIKHFSYQPQSTIDASMPITAAGRDSKTNAEITLKVLHGEKGIAREMTVLNAAFAFYIADKVENIKEGIKLANETIDSGRAFKKLTEFKTASKDLST